jgi:sulfate adenylyltransferase subunit 1 (EFTu-like GTPase family)
MRKSLYALFVAVASLCSACNFSVGTNTDLTTGLSYSYNGFRVDRVVLVGPDNAAMGNNEVVLNSQVTILVQGLSNYELKNEKAFPGMSMTVTDKGGVAVISEADLFSEGKEGYPAVDASSLRSIVTVAQPMVSGETYHVKIRVWDKIKPENELTAEVDLKVK